MHEGMKACMNCGVCTAVCPAAEFYNYDPRQIVSTVQTQDDEAIEALLRSETIWYCGECMSCRPRCPRGNTPGYVVQALRNLSQKIGFFTESEKGRQQFALKRLIGENILRTGYCITPRLVNPDMHPEQGPVWKWVYDNDREVFGRFNPTYMQEGPGAMRRRAVSAGGAAPCFRRQRLHRRHIGGAAAHLRGDGRHGVFRQHRAVFGEEGARAGVRRRRRGIP